jgi:hypothetical protein
LYQGKAANQYRSGLLITERRCRHTENLDGPRQSGRLPEDDT